MDAASGRKLKLLLGNSEGLLNSLIENLIQELCGQELGVQSTRVTRFDEFVAQGSTGTFDLLVVIPNNLISEHTDQITARPIQEASEAVRAIKRWQPTPVLVVSLFEHRTQEEALLRQAGADAVLEIPFGSDDLKASVCGLLGRPVPAVTF